MYNQENVPLHSSEFRYSGLGTLVEMTLLPFIPYVDKINCLQMIRFSSEHPAFLLKKLFLLLFFVYLFVLRQVLTM